MFRAATTLRGLAYDAGLMPQHALGLPTLSVGNLTVGGTGKTPVSNWLAHELMARGATPAILLRGYGDDESRVHQRLAKGAIVVADANRTRAAHRAASMGAHVLVLDDGFQHRRVRRDADVVLVSADAFASPRWPLPAGPWREPLRALRRATMVIVTCKSASAPDLARTVAAVAGIVGDARVAVVRLVPGPMVAWEHNVTRPLQDAVGQSALAISAIGDPLAFERQLADAGLTITPARYRDHHAFTPADVQSLVARMAPSGLAVCTLKDAVKLGPFWPHEAAPLWYVSQRVVVDRGADTIAQTMSALVGARRPARTSPEPRATH